MTRYSQPTEFPAGSKPDRFARRIAAARLVVAWERIWPLLWPATGIAGLAVAVALFDVLAPMPWPLHALLLAAIVTAIALALYFNLQHFTWPNWDDGARRLERDSGLAHRPVSEGHDVLAAGSGDPVAEELWRAHLLLRLRSVRRMRLRLPHSDLAKRDPRGLRFVVLALVAFGAIIAGSDWNRRLQAALGPDAASIATIDAWIDPPTYTGEAPIYLAKDGPYTLHVPQGSVLNLRVHGADHPPSVTLDDVRFDGRDGEYAATATLKDTGHVHVRAGGHTIGSWKIAIIPDRKPTIAFVGRPSATDRQALKLSYKASDDYGVVSAKAIIRPHGRNGAPIILDLQLPERSAKAVSETIYRDLTEHPYAGLPVDITLEAEDAAGQTASSNTVTFRLPQRVFTDPLARALIEQRQALASIGEPARARVLRTLDALTLAPQDFYEGHMPVYLALRDAFHALKYADGRADFERVEDLLWQTAVALEQGGLLTMAEQLRRMQQAITQMLAQGAPQEDIDAMLQRYAELMQQYLTAMAQNGAQNPSASDPNAKVLGEQDLATLLKAIEQLTQNGDRARAAQLLAFLQQLLENTRVTTGGAGGTAADNEALRGLGELMGKQRMLLDKTFRQSQGRGDPKDGGPKGLSQQQGQLHSDLNGVAKQFGGKNSPARQSLDEAGKLMDQAQQAIGMGDFPRATTLQKDVLDALRKGAESMAGSRGQGQGKSDPFGRAVGNATGATGAGTGGNLNIPDASTLKRAHDILEELRRRAGQQGRPKEELDYIDRLLKQF
ncbi:MAG: DUF4175 family protein [Alphaproteobacteria bacterium]|nr:DUF4175 family protein [Alphaproteobacteria bacterium]